MVAYCRPGDTVTSFYLIVGERVNYGLNQSKLSMFIAAAFL